MQENTVGGERRQQPRRKRGREAGVPRSGGPGEIEKILQHFVIFRNRNGTKWREPLWKGGWKQE